MSKTIRWSFALPIALLITAAIWILLTIIWNLSNTVNIVSQTDTISVGLANFGINAISSGLGILGGTRFAKFDQPNVAIVLGGIYILLAILSIGYGISIREKLTMSLAWHIWSTVAWIIGTISGAIVAKNVVPVK